MEMTFERAKALLDENNRWELRDHAFGNMEFGWTFGPLSGAIADGYSGGGRCDVFVRDGFDSASFEGDQARELRKCGTLTLSERNDEVGPDEYVEGQVMPGLTMDGVRKELTGED